MQDIHLGWGRRGERRTGGRSWRRGTKGPVQATLYLAFIAIYILTHSRLQNLPCRSYKYCFISGLMLLGGLVETLEVSAAVDTYKYEAFGGWYTTKRSWCAEHGMCGHVHTSCKQGCWIKAVLVSSTVPAQSPTASITSVLSTNGSMFSHQVFR